MGHSSSDDKMSKWKETKKYLPATVAWILLLTTTSLFFIFPAQWYVKHYSIWIPIGEALIAFIVIANFTLATFMDPGVIPKASRGEDDNDDLRAPLYKTVDVHGITVRMKWCVTCQFYRPPRCSHCSVCNHCIETFDHHCPWVNNCIGRRNYRFFFMFLMSLSVHMIAIFSLCLIYLLQHMEQMSELDTIISVAVMVVICILFFPIVGLTGFHIVLVSRGRTTNEQVTGKYRGGYNPFSRGCCHNCWYTLFGPQYPGLVRARKYLNANVQVVYEPTGNSVGGRGPQSASSTTGGDQVKVYVDNGTHPSKSKSGTLPSLHSPRSYRQMLPSSNRELSEHDLGLQASQSLDCEPTPPIQRHGSKSNFFLPTNPIHDESSSSMGHIMRPVRSQYAHGSPHPNRQRSNDGGRSRSQTPDSISPEHIDSRGTSSPTFQQKMRSMGGVPTPFTTIPGSPIGRRSSPSTPTQPGRPDFMGMGLASNSHSRIQPAQYYDPYGSQNGERRFFSEGALMYERQLHGMGQQHRDTDGSIRELASSPERGVYTWKDSSPTVMPTTNFISSNPNYYHSNPTSPIQHNALTSSSSVGNSAVSGRGYYHNPPSYNPSPNYMTGSNGPPPLSPNMKKKLFAGSTGVGEGVRATASPSARRPISFVRALEMTDTIHMGNRVPNNRNSPVGGTGQSQPNEMSDRSSVYDMNYEISV